MQTFYAMRMTENEFHDFKPYKIESQFSDIAKICYRGYSRNDKVLLARSLSDHMFTLALAKYKDKEPNPFLQVDSVKPVMCRIYSQGGSFMPDE